MPRRLLRRLYSATTTTAGSAEAAADNLLQRPLPSITDWLTPQNSHLLSLSTSPYLRTSVPRSATATATTGELPPGHHLVYFPPQLPEHLLLPDGSDAEQSPGAAWPRRMWAGGSLAFSRDPRNRLRYFDEAVLRERVENVHVRGGKLFVWFERRMFRVPAAGEEPAVVEHRCLAFMPPVDRDAPPVVQRTLKVRPHIRPDFAETFTPSRHLLFRFSALTHNAHRIHYDDAYSRGEEGYSANLCHGPLAVVFLLGLLKRELPRNKRVVGFEYKCLAPMFVEEPYRIAGRWKGGDEPHEGPRNCELWVETPKGGYAVRSTAEVEDDAE